MYKLPNLEYTYDALEPYIDKETMVIHHDKHHQGYLNNLNDILKENPKLQTVDPENIFSNLSKVPEDVKQKFINNAGGFVNHNLFWKTFSPKTTTPDGSFKNLIDATFGAIDNLKQKISDAALSQFGSGWGWLVVDSGKLEVIKTANQDSPLLQNKTPLFGIDVWEHAYYLKYQNLRADYIAAWWNIVNWNEVERRYKKFSS